jgi:hypothetical protein
VLTPRLVLPRATTVNKPARFKSRIARFAVSGEQPIRRARSDTAIFARPFGFVFLHRVNHASDARNSNVFMVSSTKSLMT